jgi:hypothetical protein
VKQGGVQSVAPEANMSGPSLPPSATPCKSHLRATAPVCEVMHRATMDRLRRSSRRGRPALRIESRRAARIGPALRPRHGCARAYTCHGACSDHMQSTAVIQRTPSTVDVPLKWDPLSGPDPLACARCDRSCRSHHLLSHNKCSDRPNCCARTHARTHRRVQNARARTKTHADARTRTHASAHTQALCARV